jgi:peptidoglycan-associated lipoprotein
VGALALAALAGGSIFTLGGCSSSQKTGGPGGPGGPSGLGEQGLGNKNTSLQEFQKGTLGGAEGGGPLSDIHFDYNDFTIRAQDGEILRTNAAWLNANPKKRVQVEGHCDERGSEDYNIALGAKRAQATKDYLVTLGIAGDRISTISYGKELPLCNEHDESCWARNRRAHFVISE